MKLVKESKKVRKKERKERKGKTGICIASVKTCAGKGLYSCSFVSEGCDRRTFSLACVQFCEHRDGKENRKLPSLLVPAKALKLYLWYVEDGKRRKA